MPVHGLEAEDHISFWSFAKRIKRKQRGHGAGGLEKIAPRTESPHGAHLAIGRVARAPAPGARRAAAPRRPDGSSRGPRSENVERSVAVRNIIGTVEKFSSPVLQRRAMLRE